MKISAKMQDAMNQQMGREFGAYYFYLAMAAWFAYRNFDGFARWMRAQAAEEAAHAMRFFDYIIDRGGEVSLEALDRPKAEWKSVLGVFEAARAHEVGVSAGIHKLYALALAEKDYASQAMLQWFITEQVEEEKTSTHIVATLRIIGDSASGLLIYDRELGARNRPA
ncbi:MAG TPA: ferritin [Gemmatimonadales bacterium]|jgi:ferritin|nr:ferritin [Gemmatimonadales bacterium]